MFKDLKLIIDSCEFGFNDYEIIHEQKNENSPKQLKIKGPYIVTEKRNGNGRIYKRKLMEGATKKFDENIIKKDKGFGALEHPDHCQRKWEEACHKIIKLEQDENIWIGESLVLMSQPEYGIKGTPNGDILASIIQYGGKPGMSSRGVGKISKDNIIDEKYEIVAVDSVENPSGPGCYTEGILESKRFMIDQHGDIVEQAYEILGEKLKNIPTHSTKTEEGNNYIKMAVREFINNLSI